jgi:hypothetical protein
MLQCKLPLNLAKIVVESKTKGCAVAINTLGFRLL